MLAQRTSLDQNLSGGDVKNAFQASGLFLEASLANGTASSAGVLDLKAALIVLRQTLLLSLGAAGVIESPATAAPQPGAQNATAANTASPPQAAAASTLSPSLSPEIDGQEILLPQARVPVAEDVLELDGAGQVVLSAAARETGSSASTIGAVLNLLQEALQEIPRQNDNTSMALVTRADARNDDVTVHTNTPPPPFRGALPSAQPAASPSIGPNTSLMASSHQLLGDTDAAIARQTLLQVASLPDRVDITGARVDGVTPRWSFEIPFVTPQGTAVTQFEISRDGGGSEVAAAKRVWRARFSIDIEPAGPIHALVSLSGRAHFRADVGGTAGDRGAIARRLAQLSQALSRAELQPAIS